MDDYNHMDWVLHNTKGHTPAGYRWTMPGESPLGLDIKWCVTDTRHDADGTTQEIEANILLVKHAPLLREEVVRMREEVKRHRPPKVDGAYMAWSDSHPKHDRRTWIEQVMEGITDVGYWTWVNWQLQYGDEDE